MKQVEQFFYYFKKRELNILQFNMLGTLLRPAWGGNHISRPQLQTTKVVTL